VHKQSQITLRARKVDSIVLEACAGYAYLHLCPAGQSAERRELVCKGALWEVENVRELYRDEVWVGEKPWPDKVGNNDDERCS